MITIAKFAIKDVLPFTNSHAKPKIFTVNGVDYKVNMTSLKYQCFKSKGLVCVTCKKEGTFFLLQQGKDFHNPALYDQCKFEEENGCSCYYEVMGRQFPHFNLYHIDEAGKLTMMTRDHIIPRSKGGPDTLANSATMCQPCNSEKGNKMPPKGDL